jgi:hypothetical protein
MLLEECFENVHEFAVRRRPRVKISLRRSGQGYARLSGSDLF